MIHPLTRPVRALAALLSLAAPLVATAMPPARAQSLFGAAELDQGRFVIVAAPIGDGSRAQLNIYEQRSDARPCFAVQAGNPAQVNPLLATFDFTGICNRYIDANGYSLRIGGSDLATVYRLSVLRQGGDNLLLAIPTRAGAGPEMLVARSGGHADGFLLLVPEPGWKLMRRTFGGRALGHVYLHRETWPEGVVVAPGPGAGSAPAPAAAPTPALVPAATPPALMAPAAAPIAPGSPQQQGPR
ncbi:MAG: hypothetical protein RLZZ124_492 [Cyanobacteriota bacterium]